jgi:hypothetical protein
MECSSIKWKGTQWLRWKDWKRGETELCYEDGCKLNSLFQPLPLQGFFLTKEPPATGQHNAWNPIPSSPARLIYIYIYILCHSPFPLDSTRFHSLTILPLRPTYQVTSIFCLIHPEDGVSNLCYSVGTISTHNTAKFQKLKLHITFMPFTHSQQIFW